MTLPTPTIKMESFVGSHDACGERVYMQGPDAMMMITAASNMPVVNLEMGMCNRSCYCYVSDCYAEVVGIMLTLMLNPSG